MRRQKAYAALLALFGAAMPVLAGCMLMMPIMTAPAAFKTAYDSDSGHKRLVEEAVRELAANRGVYEIIEPGRIESEEYAFPPETLRKMILDQMRSSGIRVPEEHPPEHTGGKGLSDEGTDAHAILDAGLALAESQDRLDLSLKDARTGQVVWKKRFTSSHGTLPFGHSH